MNTIYILQKGDYHRNRNVLVTTDVKLVADEYIKIIKEDGYGCAFDNPYIEIWNDNDRDFPTAEFHENTRNKKQLIKYLSKLGRKIS